jgi:ABC-type dipeptide/oligopeptide/nickel transport system permease component
MKNSLTRAVVFIVLGACLLILSIYTRNTSIEKWSSFFFGFSFPLFIGGVISMVQYFRKPQQSVSANS